MQVTDIPARFTIPFAADAGSGFWRQVPTSSQIGIQAGAASLTDGFPPVCFLPIAAGGTPPWGQDMNGILKQITQWCQWQAAGGPAFYNSAFATAAGGYPAGTVLSSSTIGYFWLNTVDNNTTDPDAGGAGWQAYSPIGIQTGMTMFRLTLDTVPGWVIGNGTTIGSAASGASQLANAGAAALYKYFWDNFSNTRCPVTGGRGANAAADFAANKPLGTLQTQGLGIKGMDTMGGVVTTLLNGVPVVTGSRTTPGSVLGENLHSLVTDENAPHVHGVTDPGHDHNQTNDGLNFGGGTVIRGFVVNGFGQTMSIDILNNTTGISIQNSGLGNAHNTVDQSMIGAFYFKL